MQDEDTPVCPRKGTVFLMEPSTKQIPKCVLDFTEAFMIEFV
jgi:hypothetical protein